MLTIRSDNKTLLAVRIFRATLYRSSAGADDQSRSTIGRGDFSNFFLNATFDIVNSFRVRNPSADEDVKLV